ncbi:MAG: phosphoribosylformylglycinamidine synthase subunit PurS [Elusimicrobia bacterium]|nr:phosphoribosylformylglycinamidine synthase subunit PurS [Elusimicrobiota bacterium]
MSAAAPSAVRAPGAEAPRFLIEVGTKAGMPDAAGDALTAQLPLAGVSGVRETRVLSLYELRGKLTASQVSQVARDLLADPVTQEYRVERSAPPLPLGPHWRLEVWLKASMTDPVGESVRKAVRDLGLPEPASVRTGTAYLLFGRLAKAQAERALERLLANPVVHRATAEPR